MPGTSGSEPLWLFGYGSLIWRPAFAFSAREPAFVAGWVRRFWQGSTDHRGVPGAPGRVVTLVREAGARCWGVAYRIDASLRDEVLAVLDHREQGGYERHRVEVRRADGSVLAEALVYVATEGNESFLGPAPLESIAAQIRSARGPSGDNLEYVVRLADELRALGAHDAEVFALEATLRGPGA